LNRPRHFFQPDRLLDTFNPFAVNLMKGGIVYSNFVTTVSPRYSDEIKYSAQGNGLGHTLYVHGDKMGGVLNGVDYDVWNPETDIHIPYNYGVDNLDVKYGNKEVLRHRLLLRQDYKPVIAYIGRLDSQKGVDLIRHAIFYSLERGCQFVLLGSSPDHDINYHFWHLKNHLNNHPDCHLEIGFSEELAHLIYAGSDMIVVPSLFEPCGLTQLIAMKYGTVPIVRETGGLADTVFDADHSDKPDNERNGYVFEHYNNEGLEFAMNRAICKWYSYPDHFRELIVNGMNCDYSWNHPGGHYMNIYEHILDR